MNRDAALSLASLLLAAAAKIIALFQLSNEEIIAHVDSGIDRESEVREVLEKFEREHK